MDQPLLNALCESVDGAGLMRHVGAFAQRVKLSGSTGEADSLRYVRAELDSLHDEDPVARCVYQPARPVAGAG